MHRESLQSFLLEKLPRELPVLLICLVAFVIAIIHLRNSPAGSLLILAGIGVLSLTTAAHWAFAWHILHHVVSATTTRFTLTAIFSLRNFSLIFFVLAAFAGRSKLHSDYSDFHAKSSI